MAEPHLQDNTPTRQGRRRRRGCLRALGIAVAVPVLAWLVAYAYWTWQLGQRLAELRRQGEPTTLAEIIPAPVPDAVNAAVLYQQVFHCDFSPVAEGASPRPLVPFAGLTPEEEVLLRDYLREPTPERDVQVGLTLDRPQVRETLRVLEGASQRDKCVFPVRWEDGFNTLFPHLPRFRSAAQLVSAAAVYEGQHGHGAASLNWLTVGLRMARHAGSDPTLMAVNPQRTCLNWLGMAAQRTLSGAVLSVRAAEDLDEALSAEEIRQGFRASLRGERAFNVSAMLTIEAPARWLLDCDIPWAGAALRLYASPSARPLRHRELCAYLDRTTQVIPWAERSYRAAAAPLSALLPSLSRRTERVLFLPLRSAAASSGDVRERDEAIARLGLLRTAVRLEQYRQARGGYPGNLAALQPALGWEPPEDPFSGKPLVYRPVGKGYLMYSLGPNLKDDGGLPERDSQGNSRTECDLPWSAQG